jgi:hypothetical protein
LSWIIVLVTGFGGWAAALGCFLGSVVSAVILAATTLLQLRAFPVPLRLLGLVPTAATGVLLLITTREGVPFKENENESNAVRDAEKAVSFYLPRLLKDPTIATGELYKMSDAAFPDNPFIQEKRRREKARAEKANQKALNKMRALSEWEFKGLTGEGYGHPVWNIQGHHYLTADRWASFRQPTISTGKTSFGVRTVRVTIYALNPSSFGHDAGLVITNSSKETGLDSVGKMKFMVQGSDVRQIRVFVAHDGVKRQ